MVDRTVEHATSAPPVSQEYIPFEDYLRLYDGQHAEWLIGKVLVHMSNNEIHQELVIFLTVLLRLYLDFKKIGRLMVAPFSMYISDNQPAREPDLMVILNEHREQVTPTYLNGPADVVIEIVSPESTERDYGAKFTEYETAGVQEYWLFDPQRRQADVYVLGEDKLYHRNPLDAEERIFSTLLPGFALPPAILWQEEYPQGAALLQMVSQMTGMDLGV